MVVINNDKNFAGDDGHCHHWWTDKFKLKQKNYVFFPRFIPFYKTAGD